MKEEDKIPFFESEPEDPVIPWELPADRAEDREEEPEEEHPCFEEEDIEVKVERDPELATWEHERIIVHRVTFTRMLAIGEKNFPGMWTLYCFYFEKARKDKTNQPWALDKYCMKGLRWSKDHFYKIKKLLLENEFIEQIVRRNKNNTKIDGFYIKVNHMNSTNNVKCPENQDSREVKCPEKPTSRKNLPVGKTDTSPLTIELEVLKKDNKNVNVAIASFFDYFEVPKKDRKMWMNQFKDNREYLLKLLKYAKEHEDKIDDFILWFQASIRDEYMKKDRENEAVKKREEEWVIQ